MAHMSQQFYLESALLPQGWTPGVYVTVAGGIISAIDTDASTTASPTAPRTAAEQVSGAGHRR